MKKGGAQTPPFFVCSLSSYGLRVNEFSNYSSSMQTRNPQPELIMTSRQAMQFLALGLIFIVLPAGSWYYLNQGYEYRKALLEELDQNLGSISDFNLKNQHGKLITTENTKGKATIINLLSLPASNQDDALIKQLFRVQDQFDKRDDIIFLTFVQADSEEQVASYFESLQVKRNKNQWHFLKSTSAEKDQIAENIAIKKKELGVAIADQSGVIRYTYDFKDSEAIKKLILHIAELMPRDKDKRELRQEN